jgi:hypothetical protein
MIFGPKPPNAGAATPQKFMGGTMMTGGRAGAFHPDPNFLSGSPMSTNIEDRHGEVEDQTDQMHALTEQLKQFNDNLFGATGGAPAGAYGFLSGGRSGSRGIGAGSGGGGFGGYGDLPITAARRPARRERRAVWRGHSRPMARRAAPTSSWPIAPSMPKR